MEELLKALSEIASIAQNGISGSARDDALMLARIRNVATAAQQSVQADGAWEWVCEKCLPDAHNPDRCASCGTPRR